MAKLSIFRSNKEAELNGTWTQIGHGMELLIARIGNKNYQQFLQKHGKALRPALKHGISSAQTSEELETLVRKAVAKHVLLGWKNVEDEDGNPLQYSPELAEKLFIDMPDFYKIVVELADGAELFRQDTQQDSLGNS